MFCLSATTFDRFIRSLVVTAILLTAVPITNARVATASFRSQVASVPVQRDSVPSLPILQHVAPTAPKQSTRVFLPIKYKTWQTASLSQHSSNESLQPSEAQITPQQATTAMAANGPMFIENVGQFDPQARFLMRGDSDALFLSNDALWYTFLDRPQTPLTHTLEFDSTSVSGEESPTSGVHLKLSFLGANPHPRLEPFNRLDSHVSYFVGDYPAKWRADVPVWGGVRYVNLYPGIDLELINERGQLRQRLVVRDGEQLSQVRLKVDGAQTVTTHRSSNRTALQLTTTIGDVSVPLFEVTGLTSTGNLSIPVIQDNMVATPFANAPIMRTPGLQSQLQDRLASPLAITNTSDLRYATYLGGAGDDLGYGIALDNQGSIYVTGYTRSSSFPTTTGAFSTTLIGSSDAFVTKIGATGAISYSTFLGGNGTDIAWSIAVDSAGNAYVTGYTTASFPISTSGQLSFTTSVNGANDVFVTKLNSTGTNLMYSTVLGGSGLDQAYGIAVDLTGAAYVAGYTNSPNYPTAGDALQTTYSITSSYGFFSKLNPLGTSLAYSTYLGGVGSTTAYAVAVDSSAAAYLTGYTSVDGLATNGTHAVGHDDVFIAKLDTNGSGGLSYFTYLGGTDNDYAYGIAVDSTGAAYVAGLTQSIVGWNQSGGFPTTPNAYIVSASQDLCGVYVYPHGFAAKLAPDGGHFLYSTYLYETRQGPNTDPECLGDIRGDPSAGRRYAIAVDDDHYAYITGGGGIHVTSNAYSSIGGGFIVKLGYAGDSLEYATKIPTTSSQSGPHTPVDYMNSAGSAIAVTGDGVAYVTGQTYSGFPTSGAAQPNYGGGYLDAFVFGIKTYSFTQSRMFWRSSCPLCSVYSSRNHRGGPIDTLTGNYTYVETDKIIPVLGGSLSLERSYIAEARDLYTRTLGYGWTHNQEIRLVFPTDPGGVAGQVQLQAPGGSQLPFFDLGNGGYQAYPGVTASMARITATGGITTYVVTATNQTVYTFNSAGLVTQTVNPAGNVITYTYYPTGSLQSVQSYGRSLRFYYDTQNRLHHVLDPLDRATQFEYNVNGDLAVVTDTRLLTWTYQYSGTTHLLTRILDPDQKTVERTEYDGQGRAIKQYNGQDELVVQLQFGAGGVITVTDGLTRTSVDRYGRGTWLGGTDSATQAITRTYDANFKPSFIADPNGNGPQMRWSANGGNLERVTDARGYTTTMGYDGLNNLQQITDTRGFTTSYTYSGTLLTRQTDALGNTTIYTYGQNSLLTAQQDALGRITQFENGTFGERKAVTVTDASGAIYSVTRYQYDPVGRLITTTDPIGRITINSYNDGDQLIAVTNNYTTASTAPKYLDTWNLITRYGYDGFGRQIAVTDTLNQVTRNWYDAAGRLISVTANFSPTVGQNYSTTYNLITRYGYDTVGNRIWVTDTLSQATRTEYDNLNRPVTVTTNYKGSGAFIPSNSDENVIRITHYDPAGNVIEQIGPPNASGEQCVTRTWYDALNRVYSTTVNFTATLSADPNTYNLTTWYEYDAAGNQTAITDTAKHVTRNYYDRVGRLISTTANYSPTLGINAQNQFNLTTRYEYDKIGNRVAITDATNTAARYGFDALNRLVVMTQNFTLTNGLDASLYNLVTRYRYDAVGNRLAVTDALTHTTIYTYDAVGRLMAEGNSVIGNVTRYHYDALGRTVVVTDPLTHTLRTYYDAAGRVVSTTNALTGTTVITYDALGRSVGIINENGKTSTTGYDGLGRTIVLTDALSGVTRYGYDAVGNRVTVTDPLTHTTVYTYDIAGRLIAQADALGNKTRTVYDGLGNRLVVTDANGIATGYGYDTLNRLSVVTESLTTTLGLDATRYNITTTYGYDAIGNRTVMTNARGYTTTYGYDVLSRLISLRDPLGSTTRYRYDAVGNRVAMTDALTQTTAYRYDELNRVLAITYTTGMSNVVYAYDKVGNRTFMTDAVGTTRYGYDALNRPISITDALTGTVQYRYDAVGNRTHLIYPDGKVVTYTFDAANRLTATLSWDGQRTTYQFDKAGRLLTTTLPNQLRLVNAYDDAGRLWNLTQWGANWQLAAYTYTLDAVGNRIAVVERGLPPTPLDYLPLIMNTYSDTQEMLLQGDLDSPFVSPLPAPDDTTSPFVSPLSSSSRPSDTASPSGAATPWPDPSLWVSAAIALAAIVALRKNGRKWAWPIALLAGTVVAMSAPQPGRGAAPQPMPFLSPQSEPEGCTLPTANGDTRVISYTYDPLSRLTNAVYSSGECYQYAYDRVGNRTVQTTTVGAITYQYDASNRLSSVNGQTYAWDNAGNLLNDGSALYRYDQANRLISTTLSGVTSLYAYTGDGVRLKQIVAGVPTTYTQDLAAPLPVVLQAKTGGTTTKYLYSMGTRPLAQYTSAWEYLLPDALGSVRQIADVNGYITLAESYEPYGKVLTSDGTASSIFGYAGEQSDTYIKLVFLRSRYYSPETARFLSKDSWQGDYIRPQSLNTWMYVEGNPINHIDPSGKDPWWCDDIPDPRQCGTSSGAMPPTPPPPPPVIPHNQHDNSGNLGGANSCGPTAVCSALEALGLSNYAPCISTMNNLVPQNNPYGYSSDNGIQPSYLEALLRAAYPDVNILVVQAASAESGIQALRSLVSSAGHQVIVDYLSDNQTTPLPDGDPKAFQKDNSFAHFARVVGFTGDNIVLAQSMDPQTNGNTLSAPISDFSQAWRDPEQRAFLAKLLPTVEQVNYWMLIMTAKGYQ